MGDALTAPRSRTVPRVPEVAPLLDAAAIREEATDLLRALLRIDTSNPPGSETPAAVELARYLRAAGIECELVARDPDRANLVARIPGTGDGPSLCFLGHTDVVPAPDAEDWTHPPFSGHLDGDGYVWGRGATDMKNETVTRAVALATLARSGFSPRGDLVLICQADEEDGTESVGLRWLVRERPDLACDYAIDEGGGARYVLTDGRVVVTISAGEKSTLPVRVTALGESGHASTPDAGANAVLRLARLVDRLGAHRPERVLVPQVRAMLDALLGSVEGDPDAAIERVRALHPDLALDLVSLLGATVSPTRLGASAALNVIPARATVDCDCRLLPGGTADELEAELRRTLGDDVPYELDFLDGIVGGSSSPVGTPLYAACQSFLDEHDPGAKLLPILLTGFCDMHFLREAFGTVAYGFWPVRTTPLDVYLRGFHNRDERIHADDLLHAIRFHLHAAQAISALAR
jgi:acetylornithine deacetylase/succinyl-diaminopimelate desuccinylase-like protein